MAAARQVQRVRKQDEARGMIWEFFGYGSEGGVDLAVVLGLDFEVRFVDFVCSR